MSREQLAGCAMFDQSFPVQGSPKLLPIYNLEIYVLRTIDRQRDVLTPGNLDWHCLAGAMLTV